MRGLHGVVWPLARLGEAVEAACRWGGLGGRTAELPRPPDRFGDEHRLEDWLEALAAWLDLDAEAVETAYADLEDLVRTAAPAVLQLPSSLGGGFLVLVRRGRRKVGVLGTDHRLHRLPVGQIARALADELEGGVSDSVEKLLVEAGVPPRRRRRARRTILHHRLAVRRVRGCWILRLPAGAPFWSQARHAGLPGLVLTLTGAHLLNYVLLILSWWMLGRGVLQGRLDPGWLLAWALMLLSIAPLRFLEAWTLGDFTTRAGALLKRRLLAGVLRLNPDELRHQGIGQFLSRVIDSEAVESLALSGGYVGLIAGVELLLAVPILGAGAGGWLHAMLLAGWLALTVLLWWRYAASRRSWTGVRLDMTHGLVETMVGHRTRLAQLPPQRWHEEEDQAVMSYLGVSRSMDRRSTLLRAAVSRGWLALGLVGLAGPFVAGTASVGRLAVGIGGVLFAYRALVKLVRGLSDLVDARIAWRNVAAVFRAAARPTLPVPPGLVAAEPAVTPDHREPVLEAHELVFRYSDRAEPVLRGCSLRIDEGDRVLLEGPSGCGKSTLASLFTGLRLPDQGLIFLRGLDRNSLGDQGWRRRVAESPQFHENHVFTDTVSFNLLMGRDWPPAPEDLEEADTVCRELGLGDLLDRMPSGLQQTVGESGWQLSHGERSRLFIARALLQRSDLVILDESFAALDPESLLQALQCVLKRAPTVLLIAHP